MDLPTYLSTNNELTMRAHYAGGASGIFSPDTNKNDKPRSLTICNRSYGPSYLPLYK